MPTPATVTGADPAPAGPVDGTTTLLDLSVSSQQPPTLNWPST